MKRWQELIKLKGITQTADELGITKQYVSQIVKTGHIPTRHIEPLIKMFPTCEKQLRKEVK